MLAATPPTGDAATQLQAAEKAYRLATYQRLLTQLGVSYEDVRVARTSPEERVVLGTRLGLLLTQPAPPAGDEVARLFLDPAAGTDTPTELSEASGRAVRPGRHRDRLSGGAAIGDAGSSDWSFDGADPGRAASSGSVPLRSRDRRRRRQGQRLRRPGRR
jgi:hypothetical protein